MPTVSNHSSNQTCSGQSITQTHRTALTKPANEDPLAEFLITALHSLLPPKGNLAYHFLLDNPQAFSHLLQVEPVCGVGFRGKIEDVVPTGRGGAIVDGHLPERSVEEADACTVGEWGLLHLEEGEEALRGISQAVQPDDREEGLLCHEGNGFICYVP